MKFEDLDIGDFFTLNHIKMKKMRTKYRETLGKRIWTNAKAFDDDIGTYYVFVKDNRKVKQEVKEDENNSKN